MYDAFKLGFGFTTGAIAAKVTWTFVNQMLEPTMRDIEDTIYTHTNKAKDEK